MPARSDTLRHNPRGIWFGPKFDRLTRRERKLSLRRR